MKKSRQAGKMSKKKFAWKRAVAVFSAAAFLAVSLRTVDISADGEGPSTVPETAEQVSASGLASVESSIAEPAARTRAVEDTAGSAENEEDASASSESESGESDAAPSKSESGESAAAFTEEVPADDDSAAGAAATEAEAASNEIRVVYQSSDETMGSVSLTDETGSVNAETGEVSFQGSTATANDGYVFTDWVSVGSDGTGTEVSTEASYTPTGLTEAGTYTYTAVFEKGKEDTEEDTAEK